MYKKILLIGSGNFVSEIKYMLSGLMFEIEQANKLSEVLHKLKNRSINIILFDRDSYAVDVVERVLKMLQQSKKMFVVLSSKKNQKFTLEAKSFGALDYFFMPCNKRELILRIGAVVNKKKRIACIGGGTGLFNLLMGIKNIPQTLLTSIVSTADDGGSSGRLRASFGVLPPGDIRRNLVALSNAPKTMNELMQYRFDKGGCLAGHSLGNLLLTALVQIQGSMPQAVNTLSDILNLNGIVYPVSQTQSTLGASFENGTIVNGESNIDLCKGRHKDLHITDLWHNPEPKCDISACSALLNADFITIGPGDLFTSIITNLIIKDLCDALVESKARKIYICNMMTKPGETSGYTAFDHIKEIIKYLKGDYLDYVILPDNSRIPKEALLKYAKKNQFPVEIGNLKDIHKLTKARVILAPLANDEELIHHDSDKIKIEIERIIKLA